MEKVTYTMSDDIREDTMQHAYKSGNRNPLFKILFLRKIFQIIANFKNDTTKYNMWFLEMAHKLMIDLDLDKYFYGPDPREYLFIVAIITFCEEKMNNFFIENSMVYDIITTKFSENFLKDWGNDVSAELAPILITETQLAITEQEYKQAKFLVEYYYFERDFYKKCMILKDQIIELESTPYSPQRCASLKNNLTKGIKDLTSLIDRQNYNNEGHFNISTENSNLKDSVDNVYDNLIKNPIYLETGSIGLDRFVDPLGRGFAPKLYAYVGRVGQYKSSLLMYHAIWFQKYNEDKFDHIIKQGLKPTVIYLSLENEKNEDQERLYYMYTGRRVQDETKESFKENYEKIIANNKIGLYFINDRPGVYSPLDIENLHKRLLNDGIYPIAWVIDYLRLFKSDISNSKDDLRISLGNITQSLKYVCNNIGVPIITAHHTNREADAIVETHEKEGKFNHVKSFGSSTISESKLVAHYLDFMAFIGVETRNFDGKKFLCIKKEKSRYESGNINYIVFPFLDDGYRLTEDKLLGKPSYQRSVVLDDQNNYGIELNTSSEFEEAHLKALNKKKQRNIEYLSNAKTDKIGVINKSPDIDEYNKSIEEAKKDPNYIRRKAEEMLKQKTIEEKARIEEEKMQKEIDEIGRKETFKQMLEMNYESFAKVGSINKYWYDIPIMEIQENNFYKYSVCNQYREQDCTYVSDLDDLEEYTKDDNEYNWYCADYELNYLTSITKLTEAGVF